MYSTIINALLSLKELDGVDRDRVRIKKSYVVLSVLTFIWSILSFFQSVFGVFAQNFLAWTASGYVEWTFFFYFSWACGFLLLVVQITVYVIIFVHSIILSKYIHKETFSSSTTSYFGFSMVYYYTYFRGGVFFLMIFNLGYLIFSIFFYVYRYWLGFQITITIWGGLMLYEFAGGVGLFAASLIPYYNFDEFEMDDDFALLRKNFYKRTIPTYLLCDLLLFLAIICYCLLDMCCATCFSVLGIGTVIVLTCGGLLYLISLYLRKTEVTPYEEPVRIINPNPQNKNKNENENENENESKIANQDVSDEENNESSEIEAPNDEIGNEENVNVQKKNDNEKDLGVSIKYKQNIGYGDPTGKLVYCVFDGKKKRFTATSFDEMKRKVKNRFSLLGDDFVYVTERDEIEIESQGDYEELRFEETVLIKRNL